MRLTRREVLLLVAASACSPTKGASPIETQLPATTPTASLRPTPAPTLIPTAPPTLAPAPPTPPTVPTPISTPVAAELLTGIDVLMRQRVDSLRGRKVGLVTNATGRDMQGRSSIDVLHAEPAWWLVALFSPEH